MRSGEFDVWQGLDEAAVGGRGEQRAPTTGPHLKQHERQQTGSSSRGVLVVQVNSWDRYALRLDFDPHNTGQAWLLKSEWQLTRKVHIPVSVLAVSGEFGPLTCGGVVLPVVETP